MPRRGENIRQRKDGLWEGRYPKGMDDKGRTKYASVYAKSYAEVKAKLLAAKTRPKKQKALTEKLYKDVLEEWLALHALTVKASTYMKFRNLVYGHIIPVLGQFPLGQLNTAQLTRFIQEKSKQGRLDGCGGLSNSTLRILLLILKSSLDFAAREQYMLPLAFTLKCPEAKREPAKALTIKEQALLEETLRGELDTSKLGILLCLYTGLRIGEVCALRWSDVDLSGGLIHVRQTVQRLQDMKPTSERKTTLMCGLPKSECSLRSLPIPPCLGEILHIFRGKPDAFVLTNQTEKPMEPRTYQYRFKRYIADAGIPDANFHVLRHTFGTRFIELGGDPKALSELLGHASVEITLNKYVHPSMENKRQQMARFSDMRGMVSGSIV